MKAIAAVDTDFGIGRDGELLAHIPDDLKRFRRLTEGHTVVMGRRTVSGFPGQRPLPNRRNIVLSTTMPEGDGFEVARSIDELGSMLSPDEEVYVIGGGIVYAELLPYCSEVNLTVIRHRFEADTFFPRMTELPGWVLKGVSAVFSYDLIKYRFEDYIRTDEPKKLK